MELVLSAVIVVIFIPIVFFTRGGSSVLTIPMLIIPSPFVGFIVYVTLAGRKMRCELEDNGFKVNFELTYEV